MKKLISVLALVLAMAAVLTACGKFTCDMCGKEKSGKKHESTLLGKTIVICNDCKEGLNDLAGALS